MPLNQNVIDEALNVQAWGQSVGRAVVDGAVVIYDLDDTPQWTTALLNSRDDDGNTHAA